MRADASGSPPSAHPGVLPLLEALPIPSAMAAAERDALVEVVKPHAPRIADRLITDVQTALDEQTVVVPAHPRQRPSCRTNDRP